MLCSTFVHVWAEEVPVFHISYKHSFCVISMVALRATARQVIRGVTLVGAANVQAHSDRRAEKTAEAE